ncbi:phospholipase-like protein [Tanacetum coccineum]
MSRATLTTPNPFSRASHAKWEGSDEFVHHSATMDLTGYEVPRVLITCRSQQLEVEGEGDENVPLYYYVTDNLTIQFGREEFCLVTGLKFGVENLAEYGDVESRIPFRRRVFPSNLDGEPITGTVVYKIIDSELFDRLDDDDAVSLCCLGILQLVLLGVEGKRRIPTWLLRLANDRVGWDNYPWGSYVWPTLYSQLKNANVKRWPKLYATQPTSEIEINSYSIFGYTWAFKTWILESFRVTATRYYYRYNRYPRVAAWKRKGKFLGSMVDGFFHGNLPAERLTPDETEARSDWWISSRAYFDGRIGVAERVPRHVNRQNMYEVPSELYRQLEEQKRDLDKQKKEIEEIKRNEAKQLEMFEKMHKFMEDMNVEQVRPANKEPIIVSQHYGISDLSQFPSKQGVPSPFQTHPNSSSFFNIGTPTHWQTPRPSQHGSSNWQAQMSAQVGPSNWQSHMPAQSATPYWQPAFPSHPGTYNPNLQPSIERHHDAAGLFNQNILNRGKREQRPSFYKRSPYMEQPATTVLPKQRGNKNKNNVKKANLSPLNLWSALDDENEGGDDVVYLGGRFTGNYLVYENVDPEKVKRENYVTYTEFLNNPEDIYLDCYMKGYSVPVTFWQQLVPHLCKPAIDSRTPVGWLSSEHMNSWMELLIRLRRSDDPWTVAYTNTVSVHPENQRFMLETDQHSIGTLDGSTRPYPAWSVVDWVFMPIHVEGNHWVTGVINLPNSHVYVFDSLPNEGRRMLLFNQIQRWTPLLNGILHGRGCFTQTRGPYNFQFSYNDGLGIQVPLQTNFSDCGVITCWLIFCLCTQRSPILNGDPQEFWETVRNTMCQYFYLSRCEDTRDCGYD